MSYKALKSGVIFLPHSSGSMEAPGQRMPATAPFSTGLFGSAIVFVYKISGRQPGFADGLLFNSCVKDLQGHPELWLDECPYLHTSASTMPTDGLRVELVKVTERASARPVSFALAA
jgi:hypothetical protein